MVKANYSNLAKIIDNCLANSEFVYSPDDSGAFFVSFYRQLGYSTNSVNNIKVCIKKTHELYPQIAWLNKAIENQGLIAVGKSIWPNSAHGTAYLHFLLIIGLISISFYDYFCVNPRSIGKLDSWLSASTTRLGIDELVQEVFDISVASENRKLNPEKLCKKAKRVGIYLILRYKLENIRSMSTDQWRSFVLECRDHSRGTAPGYVNNLAPVRHMHNALFNMGVLEEQYTRQFGGVKSIEKKREYLDAPGYGEFAKAFLAHIRPQTTLGTYQQYLTSLGLFYEFLKSRQHGNVNIRDIVRADIAAYINFLFKEQKSRKYSFSWVEARSLNVKIFLNFIATQATEFKKRGLKVFKNKIVIDRDFRVPHVTGPPKDIEEPVLKALLEGLKLIPSHRYRLTFRLMLNSGLALADVLCLKDDCISYDEISGKYQFTVWRAKNKKWRTIKPMTETVKIVEQLKMMNTQKVPTEHPDGSYAIFLLNDAGVPYSQMWFLSYFDQHKKRVAQAFPSLAAEIAKVTPHMLRHTFATMLREKGADIYLIKELMLHEHIKTTHKYTRESDSLKVELIKRIQSGEYICDEYPSLNQSYLDSQQGKDFIESLVKHENKFSYGRCTVNGFDNCQKAYRCLTCGYLFTTKEDLPEIVSAITIQRTRIQKLDADIDHGIDLEQQNALKLEREKSKARLVRLLQKLRKLQSKQSDLFNERDDHKAGSDVSNDDSIIEFV